MLKTLHLGPALLRVCRKFNDHTDHAEHRILALDHLTSFYRICNASGRFLDRSVADVLMVHVEHFLIHYNWLTHNAIALQTRVYPLQLKHHNLWHIAYHARFMNPVYCWAYQFEDHMGVIITIARNCLAGSSMTVVGNKVLENYSLVLELTLRCNIRSSIVT